jgi:hypothetical protein
VLCMFSMVQFAVGFDITPSCRGGRSKPKTRWNQKWAAGPHKSITTQRSKRQVHKSDPSELRWEHPQDKAQAEGKGREKQSEQNQGIKRMPKTRVHSTLCNVLARSQPTLTTQELQFYSWSRELVISMICARKSRRCAAIVLCMRCVTKEYSKDVHVLSLHTQSAWLRNSSCLGLARTIYIYGVYTVFLAGANHQIYGAYIRFWPTLVRVMQRTDLRIGLARAVYIHRIWPYIWWFPCHKYCIYTVYIWFWPTLLM